MGTQTRMRATITVTFDAAVHDRRAITDRLDAAIVAACEVEPTFDVHTRWVAELSDAPLFGAARRDDEEGS